MKYFKLVFSCVLGCTLYVFSGSAAAQGDIEADMAATEAADDAAGQVDVDEKAKAEFQKGIELFEAGNYVEAADSFRAAMAEKSSWKMYYNIGQSEAAAQRYGLALEAFESYLVSGGDNVPFAQKDEVLAEIERLRLLVGVVDLKAPESSELIIDGYVRGVVPIEGVVRVAAGPHHVQVLNNGEILYDADVKIAGGITTPIKVSADTDNAQTDTVAADSPGMESDGTSEPASGMPKKLLAGIITGGAGVIVTGLGVVFLIKGSKDADQAEEWNQTIPRPDDKINDYNDNTRPLNIGMTITGLAVGGAAMAVGTVFVILGLKEKKKRDVSIVPTFGGLTVNF